MKLLVPIYSIIFVYKYKIIEPTIKSKIKKKRNEGSGRWVKISFYFSFSFRSIFGKAMWNSNVAIELASISIFSD